MADDFGLKIGLEGEKEFKKALSEINQSFKVLGSEMKLVTAQFGKNNDSVEALTAKQQALGKQVEAQKSKVETLRKALKNAADSFGENDRRTQQWQIQLNNAEAELIGMQGELDDTTEALERVGQGMDDAADSAEDMADAVSDAADSADKTSGGFEKLGSIATGVAATIGAAVVAIAAAAVAAGVELVKLGDEYNKAVNQMSASTGATGAELESLGETAQRVYLPNK